MVTPGTNARGAVPDFTTVCRMELTWSAIPGETTWRARRWFCSERPRDSSGLKSAPLPPPRAAAGGVARPRPGDRRDLAVVGLARAERAEGELAVLGERLVGVRHVERRDALPEAAERVGGVVGDGRAGRDTGA